MRYAMRARSRRYDDAGQTLVIVLVIVALLAVAGATMVLTVANQIPYISRAANERAAYAAVESGIQQFRSELNQNEATAVTSSDSYVDNWTAIYNSSGSPESNPSEAFYITPDTGLLGATGAAASTSFADDVLATITGVGGATSDNAENCVATSSTTAPTTTITPDAAPCNMNQKNAVYETVVVAYKQFATYLQNAYYSEYEVLDPNYPESATSVADPSVQVSTTTNNVTTSVTEPESSVTLSYTYTNDGGTSIPVNNVSFQTAMCNYESYQENTFIDSMNSITNPFESGKDFSTTYPYYGAWFGQPSPITTQAGANQEALESSDWTKTSSTNPFTYTFTPSTGTSETIQATSPPCATPYDFLTGENFSGPVYSADELHVCGSTSEPTFSGSPISLLTRTPTDATFKYEWPGSIKGSGATAGQYVPQGYTSDPDSCSNGPVNPTLDHGLELGVNEILPSFDNSLAAYASVSSTTNSTDDGCLFTGPTMIELVYTSTGGEHMDVWSPLSHVTSGSTATTHPCGSGLFSPESAWVTGIAIPSDGVIYVQNVPTLSSDVNYTSPATLNKLVSTCSTGVYNWTNPSCVYPSDGVTSTSCWVNPEATTAIADSPTCTSGTALVEGEMYGEATIGADSNIYITRDLTYECADTGGALQTVGTSVTSLPTACSTETGPTLGPDLLGLYSNQDILWSHPQNFTGTVGANASACGAGDSIATNDAISNVEPTCTTYPGIVDALLIALQGSFGIQYYDQGAIGTPAANDGLYLYGADVAYFRGPFGVSSTHGYTKQFNYDSRLSYLSPPHAVEAESTNWYPFGWVNCGGFDLAGQTSPSCTAPN